MAYLPSIVLAALGLLVLGALVFRLFRLLRRFRLTMSMVRTSTNDRAGLIRARTAGLRVAIEERHRKPLNQ